LEPNQETVAVESARNARLAGCL
jgi:hypothetical protein